ncbi:MAG: hypothetical protein ABJA98_01685 [Acidobacteriota bacterium]
MKVNEARAKVNLPRDEDPASDEIAPQQGGPSDATAHPAEPPAKGMVRTDDPAPDDADAMVIRPILEAHRTRQAARLEKWPVAERPAAFFAHFDRWTRELAADLTPIVGVEEAGHLAVQINIRTLDALETAA